MSIDEKKAIITAEATKDKIPKNVLDDILVDDMAINGALRTLREKGKVDWSAMYLLAVTW
jgi:hypothetical protein